MQFLRHYRKAFRCEGILKGHSAAYQHVDAFFFLTVAQSSLCGSGSNPDLTGSISCEKSRLSSVGLLLADAKFLLFDRNKLVLITLKVKVNFIAISHVCCETRWCDCRF